MATQIQWRRGNTAQTATFTGAVAEITVDTDKKTIVVHDGTTSGGIPLALESSLSANSISVIAAFAKANAANVLAQAGSTLANTANTTADAAFAKANAANVLAQAGSTLANTANTTADAAFAKANAANVLAQAGSTLANTANTTADAAFAKANSANVLAQAGSTLANTANTTADAAFAKANSANVLAQAGSTLANTANTTADAAFAKANAANVLAQSAFARANNSLNVQSGGTITGDTTVTGNLTIIGTTIYANTITALIADNLLTLNASIGQASAPTVNAGIEVDRGSSDNVSILWNETSDTWTFTNDGSNYLEIADAARLNSAFALANTANIKVDSAYAFANIANTTADASFTKANTANVLAQAAFDKANTDATSITASAGIYGNATIIPVVTLIANGRVSAITNTAIQSGSTSQPGILQLNDTTTSTSTTQAATANAALTAYQLASADAVSFAIALG